MDGVAERKCSDCIFFEPREQSGGWCHRYPPVIVNETYESGQSQTCQYFPWMEAKEWCGEFKDKWQIRTERVDP